jgi:nucleoside-diphosphate-sugar epimerase
MRIAIVGSEGYLGSALVEQLRGHDLLRIDAGVWREPPKGVVVERTTRKIAQRIDRFGPDHIVWLAALAHDPAGRLSADAMHENTCRIPDEVLGSFCVPDTVISSLSVYSDTGSYPGAKRALEDRITSEALWRKYTNIFRFGTLFGGTNPETFRTHLLLNKMTMDAVVHKKIAVSNPSLRRPVLHLEWAVDRILTDIFNPGPRGEIINALDHCDTIGGYASLVARALKLQIPHSARAQDPDERDYGWDIRNPIAIEQEVVILADWIRKNYDRFNHQALENLYAWHDRYYL